MNQEQIAAEKRAMLAAMLAGKPTKESQAISKIVDKIEGKVVNSYQDQLLYEESLPSANNLNITKE